ncbi:hypothetical protein BH23GEM7_BH23GEM7_12040 [soil metagenome]|nr:hypothetical protein [Gemmatimonadota bacterium]
MSDSTAVARRSTEEHFTRGGKPLLDLLAFCVMSYRVEALFAFLVREYRMQPTPLRALALFDVFCAPQAPARMRVLEVLPPRNLVFQAELERLRERWIASQPVRLGDVAIEPGSDEMGALRPPPVAPKYVFDFLLAHLQELPEDPIGAAGRQFDPALSPDENLPGGRMSAGQRAFVEKIWQPRIRPMLVAAGFWRIATVA